MNSNSRGTKLVLMALKNPAKNIEKWQIKHASQAPSEALNADIACREELSVESGNILTAGDELLASLDAKGNPPETGIRSRSSSSSTSFSEDNDDSLADMTYLPSTISSESDSETNSKKGDCDIFINEVESCTNSTSIYPSSDGTLGSILNTPSSCSLSNASSPMMVSSVEKGLKRKRNESNWIRNVNKKLRNSGKAYKMHATEGEFRNERKMRPPCTGKCKLKCATKLSEEERTRIFNSYWELSDIEKQRQYIANNMEPIQPKYQYVRIGGTRKKRESNNAYYFRSNEQKLRVCKTFFKNTLDINDRPIRTVQEKRNSVATVLLEEDRRGKHGKHKKIDNVLKEGVRKFVEQIPKIESHYTRANTSKHFIDGSKSIADIHRDYINNCKQQNIPFVNYVMFYRIFTEDFNISFFTPKKDLCETCCAYENAEGKEKEKKKEFYDQHLVEKELSRKEKTHDKEESNATVAVYDLQAVMQIPKGNVSVFYYKSKLNVFNFTIYDLHTHECECFVWDESNGHRGINELGSCILQFLNKKASDDGEFIFYSDNCAGQQKNKFMVALYLYAVSHLNIKSITHKFLIKGHTQNEGDSAHSLIERQVKRQLKSGPMYTPESFIAAIRSARKTGKPFNVTELCFEDFFDIKALATEMGLLNMSQLKIATVKVLRVESKSLTSIFFKTSYEDKNFEVASIIRKKKIKENITLTRAFKNKPLISNNKKQDLLELVEKNHIPKFYKPFYEQL